MKAENVPGDLVISGEFPMPTRAIFRKLAFYLRSTTKCHLKRKSNCGPVFEVSIQVPVDIQYTDLTTAQQNIADYLEKLAKKVRYAHVQ